MGVDLADCHLRIAAIPRVCHNRPSRIAETYWLAPAPRWSLYATLDGWFLTDCVSLAGVPSEPYAVLLKGRRTLHPIDALSAHASPRALSLPLPRPPDWQMGQGAPRCRAP